MHTYMYVYIYIYIYTYTFNQVRHTDGERVPQVRPRASRHPPYVRAKYSTREITKVNLHWKMPLNIHRTTPLKIHNDF